MAQSYRRFLDPEVVTRLKGLDLKARLVVEGFLTGLHKSPYRGFSVEFAEHRQYMPGDEIRKIDWKVWGKTDRFYVKEFEEETNMKGYLLLDASGSMGYSSSRLSKLEYSSLLSAALAFLLLQQQDSVGLITFDTKIRRYIPPRSTALHLHNILKELDGLSAGGETNVSVTFHELAERIKRRGLIIVISDLLDDPREVLLSLKHFRHRKHEVIVFHVLDKFELEFPFEKSAIFRDMETKEEIPVYPQHLRREYKRSMDMFTESYKRKCRENSIDYLAIDTSTPYGFVLSSYLAKRKRLH
ncbi:MAG: DUF58 domain-containing protein [bacterium]